MRDVLTDDRNAAIANGDGQGVVFVRARPAIEIESGGQQPRFDPPSFREDVHMFQGIGHDLVVQFFRFRHVFQSLMAGPCAQEDADVLWRLQVQHFPPATARQIFRSVRAPALLHRTVLKGSCVDDDVGRLPRTARASDYRQVPERAQSHRISALRCAAPHTTPDPLTTRRRKVMLSGVLTIEIATENHRRPNEHTRIVA